MTTTRTARTVAVNTGTRIHKSEVFTRHGRTYIKVVADLGAAFTPMAPATFAPMFKGYWFDLGTKGLALRTGEAAVTALDEHGQKRPGYRG